MPTLSQHVCFTCRKVFKKPHEYAFLTKWRRKVPSPTVRKCPQCARDMIAMGYKFRAPRISDIGEWTRIERALQEGRDYAIPTIRKPRPAA